VYHVCGRVTQEGWLRRTRAQVMHNRSGGRFAPARTAPRASPSASSLLAVLAAAEPAVAADTRLVHFVPSLARLTRGAVRLTRSHKKRGRLLRHE
jgi:hypothetical protein